MSRGGFLIDSISMVKRQNSGPASSRHDESKHQRRSSSGRTSGGQQRRGEGDGNENNLDSTDPYVVLGVERSASAQQIRSSYKRLALRYHPDRAPSDKEGANRRFAAISK